LRITYTSNYVDSIQYLGQAAPASKAAGVYAHFNLSSVSRGSWKLRNVQR
jgi:hypothetical protein